MEETPAVDELTEKTEENISDVDAEVDDVGVQTSQHKGRNTNLDFTQLQGGKPCT